MQGSVTPTVVARRQGRIGRLLLNRPSALNALTLDMVCALKDALLSWRDDPAVHAVVVEGAGKAFCAGGDVRAVRDAVLKRDFDAVHTFFSEEYDLNLLIARYPKPYVALIDGVCMGGGLGVSVHGAVRVCTDAAMLAMPETAIALFPDIGATHFLPRLRGAFGSYLALTGHRVGGADAAWVGLATHVVARERLAGLADAIAAHGLAALAEVSDAVRPGPLAAVAQDVERCFTASDLPTLFRRLEAEGTDWARDTLATLRRMSPSSLAWTFGIVGAGTHRTLEQCLAAELALTDHVVRHPDFAEGVRAMVVDKDRTPRWSPSRLDEVDPGMIAAMLSASGRVVGTAGAGCHPG